MRLIGIAVVLSLCLFLSPLAQAQPVTLPLIAVLDPGLASNPSVGTAYFKEALARLGWVEGRTVRFETRYGEYQPDRTSAMAKELVALKPDVLYTSSDGPVRAAMRGAKAGDLPVEQPTKVDLTINLKAAKTLGLTVPQSVLVRAGEIIQ